MISWTVIDFSLSRRPLSAPCKETLPEAQKANLFSQLGLLQSSTSEYHTLFNSIQWSTDLVMFIVVLCKTVTWPT